MSRSKLVSLAAYRRAKAKLRGTPTRAELRAAKLAERAKRIRAIAEAVIERSQNFCESCGRPAFISGQLDHWLGGSGRRRAKESIETTWLLCMICHQLRTENKPSVRHWNDVFRTHCECYGYPFVPHLVKPTRRKS